MSIFPRSSRLLSFLLLLLLASGAHAWVWAYGPVGTGDQARRVAVANCPAYGPGYISVGTFDAFGVNPDVYVVYTALGGLPLWEHTYDVLGLGLPDEGMAIVAVPNGFVILSNIQYAAGIWSPALTWIPCTGGTPRTLIYPAATGLSLWGRDLIRTQTGTPGDLVVAGHAWNGQDEDAFLMRTTAAGAAIWASTYDNGSTSEAFHAVTENLQGATGDLVAAGRFTAVNGDLQGLVARVSGVNGGIGPLPQCMASHGTPTNPEVYDSVTTLAGFPGQFVMIGTTVSPAWQNDVWMTRGTPCAVAAQSRIGNPFTFEQGNDLRQLQGASGAMLAIAGHHAPAGAATRDATFLQVNAGSLMPMAGTGRLFGGTGDENFHSLAQDPAGGWVLAGFTETDWEGLLDPRDLYLVHHDPGNPGCSMSWAPSGVQTNWPAIFLQPRRRVDLLSYPVPVLDTQPSNPWLICP